MAVTPEERRKAMRGKIFASRTPKSEIVRFFDEDIEIRQPSVRLIMEMANEEDKALAVAKMLIGYAFVPETSIKVFDDTDVEQLVNMPFNEDWTAVNTAIGHMTGVEVEVAEEVKNSS